MALTEKDKELLSADDQKKIDFLTKVYDNAKAKGDTNTMNDAASQASTIRNNAGYKTDSSGNYTGRITSGSGTVLGSSSSNTSGNSQYSNGNYTIGSEKGQQIAQSMGFGAENAYTASDGSVWTKNNDGTISVNHNGTITQNAYTPTDYSVLLKQQMAAGLPYQDVQNTLNARVDKATGDPALEKYAYDEWYDRAWDYIQNAKAAETQQNEVEKGSNWRDSYTASNPAPTYSGTDSRIDDLLDEILKREGFSYNAAADPLYYQYQNMYKREGDRAMRDTLAEVASGAGGMNSYAVTAAQQAQNYYNSQLADKIPELYQLAYEMYLTDIDNKVRDLGLLQQMDATEYNRYRDTMQDWKDDRNFAYGAYQDAIAQGNWQTQFDYNADVNDRDFAYNDYWANKEWNEAEDDEKLTNSRYDTESAKAEVEWYVSMGVMPKADLISKAGMDYDTIAQMVEQQKASSVPSSSSSDGSYNNDTNTLSAKDAYSRIKDITSQGVMPNESLIEQAGMDYNTVLQMAIANGYYPEEEPEVGTPTDETQTGEVDFMSMNDYQSMREILDKELAEKGAGQVMVTLDAALNEGAIGYGTYQELRAYYLTTNSIGNNYAT